MSHTEGDDQVTEAWKVHRPYLVDLAYRMLGDIGEAEDVVQEAFVRLVRTGVDRIDDERGWLIVVTSRLCLDQIRSARSRRQRTGHAALDEPVEVVGAPVVTDPADRVTLDDNVRLALLVVLERMSPAERVVFVLHDVFQLPFETVAESVGKTAAACRQLARRARQKLGDEEGGARFAVSDERQRVATDSFIAACASGDLSRLLAVLDPDVSGTVDLRPGLVVRGADQVSLNLMRFWGPGTTLVSYPVGEHPALLGFVERRLAGVLVLTMDADKAAVTKVHAITEPSKLDFLSTQLSELS